MRTDTGQAGISGPPRAERRLPSAQMRATVGLIALAGLLALPMQQPASAGAVDVQPVAGPDLPQRSSPALRRASASGAINRSQLQRRLKRLVRRAPSSSGFYVYDLDAARAPVLFDRRQNERRKLASNTKLFTTATALQRLGAKGRIQTAVRTRGSVNGNGGLKGDLFLVGGGDPTLAGAGIRSLAKQVEQAGIMRISGDLRADDSVFDRLRGVPDSGWGPSPYIAPLAGLVYGGSTYSQDPALAAGEALRHRLRKRGIKLGGGVKRGVAGKRVRSRKPIASISSPSIAAIVEATNEDSNNFYAEMLLKRIAAETGRGTTRRGAKAVERFARSQGSGIDAKDGSGLTDGNRSSPRNVVRLLAAMRTNSAAGDAFHRSLPRAGKDGTLDERMEGTAAAGRCRAKTGTITGVSTLSGYCDAGRGTVAFSLLMNGVGSYEAARQIQDKMTIEIARYRP